MEQSSATPSTIALGPYDVLDELARTPLGPVYLGCRPDDDGPGPLLALKVLSAATPAVLPQLLRSESHVAARARVRDPRVLAAHAVEHTPSGTPMLVMEYVAGVSLSQLLAARGMAAEERLRLCLSALVDAVGGLAVLHEATHPGTGKRLNLVHGHLGPDTVGMCEDGTGCITDLELWGTTSGASARGDGAAGDAYTPPQVSTGERVRGADADVYSIGVMLWQATTSQLPPDTLSDDDLDAAYPFLPALERETPYLRSLLQVARRAMLPSHAPDSLSADALHTVLLAVVQRFDLQVSLEERANVAIALAHSEKAAVARAPRRSGMVRQSSPPQEALSPVLSIPSAKKTQLGMVAPVPEGGFDDEVTELWDAHVMEDSEPEISRVTAAPRAPGTPPPPLGRLPQPPRSVAAPATPPRAALDAMGQDLASVIIDDEDLLLDEPAPAAQEQAPTGATDWRSLLPAARGAGHPQPRFQSHHGLWLGAVGLAVVTVVLVVLVVRTGG